MLIGIPKEIKDHEYRSVTPVMVRSLTAAGHKLRVQTGAGEKIGYTDALFVGAGAEIVPGAKEVYEAEMIIVFRRKGAAVSDLL